MTILPNKSKKSSKSDRLNSVQQSSRAMGHRHQNASNDSRKCSSSSSKASLRNCIHKTSYNNNPTVERSKYARNQSDHGSNERMVDNNSDDEYEKGFADPNLESWFVEFLKKNRGWNVKVVGNDGACMFRAVADQVYGDEDMHDEVRRLCLDYMEKNRDHFSQFITEDFDQYISRKREKGVCGNHIELQAISEIYSRAIEIYQYSADPINIFNPRVDISSSSKPNAPIRLSYHGSSHYNSVVDPYEATIGVGLGLPGHSPGSADRNLVREAILKSESQLIEDAMLKDKIRLSDFECTEQQISEQIAMESYLEHLKKTQNVLSSKEVAQENKKTGGPSPGCSNTGFVEDGVEDIEVSEWSRAAQDDAEEKSLLAQVMALSQQEYLNSLIKKSTKRNDFDQAGSSKSS